MKKMKELTLGVIFAEVLIAVAKTAKTYKIKDKERFLKIFSQNFWEGMKQYENAS